MNTDGSSHAVHMLYVHALEILGLLLAGVLLLAYLAVQGAGRRR